MTFPARGRAALLVFPLFPVHHAMLKAFANCWKVPELRNRIIISIGLLFVARVGANIPLPGLDTSVLQAYFEKLSSGNGGGAVAMYNLFTGGAMLKGAVFALGVMPYISASIIMQLLGAVYPPLAKLQQEGEVGRQKISQYSRYATILIALIQGVLLVSAMCSPDKAATVFGLDSASVTGLGALVVMDHTLFILLGTMLLVSGSMIVLWLGEQITARGIGNGTSMLITIGILADIPGALNGFRALMGTGKVGEVGARYGWTHAVGMVALFIVITAALVALTQAVRKIPIQYAKRIIGRKIYGGQASYFPIKLTYAGVMPVIFAGAITTFPPMILKPLSTVHPTLGFLEEVGHYLDHGWAMQYGGLHATVFYTLYGALIFGFSYFWVSMMFKPVQIADELKKANGYIPGIHPGAQTAKFLDFVMSHLTLAGAVALLVIALMPDLFIVQFGLYPRLASFLGGTGGLITVGVVLDTMRQVETMLLQRHYEGFLKKGRIGGSMPVAPVRKVVDFGEGPVIGSLGYACIVIFLLGTAAGVYNTMLPHVR